MATFLRNLKLDELSLVTDPANKDSRVSIWKAADGGIPQAGGSPCTTKEAEMPDDVKGELEKQIADLNTRLEKAEAAQKAADERADRAEAVAKLDADQRAHFDRLEKADADKFLAMDPAARAAVVTKAKDADDVLKTPAGTVRKSEVGEDAFSILKSQHEELERQKTAIKKADEMAEIARFEKQAADEFPSLPGTDAECGAVLRHLSKADEATRDAGLKLLKAGEEAAKVAFTTLGANGGGVPGGSANDELDKLAKAKAEKDWSSPGSVDTL